MLMRDSCELIPLTDDDDDDGVSFFLYNPTNQPKDVIKCCANLLPQTANDPNPVAEAEAVDPVEETKLKKKQEKQRRATIRQGEVNEEGEVVVDVVLGEEEEVIAVERQMSSDSGGALEMRSQSSDVSMEDSLLQSRRDGREDSIGGGEREGEELESKRDGGGGIDSHKVQAMIDGGGGGGVDDLCSPSKKGDSLSKTRTMMC